MENDQKNRLGDHTGIQPSQNARTSSFDRNQDFDLQGRRLSNSKCSNSQMRKGVYIQDGRKVVR